MTLEVAPQGPFDLETQVSHFGGWPRRDDAIVVGRRRIRDRAKPPSR
jgi:hypothetical protein